MIETLADLYALEDSEFKDYGIVLGIKKAIRSRIENIHIQRQRAVQAAKQ